MTDPLKFACQFCLRPVVWDDPTYLQRLGQCNLCEFICCFRCMMIHVELAHEAEHQLLERNEEIAEKILFLPRKKP